MQLDTVRIKHVYTSAASISDAAFLNNVTETLFLSYIDMSGVIIARMTRIMKLVGNLKKEVDKAGTREEKRVLIEKAGMKLDEGELEMVAGGGPHYTKTIEGLLYREDK